VSDISEATLPAAAAPKVKGKIQWWAETISIFWLILAVLGFHSFIAKPFYIPSESMMPGLLVGDRLVVTKYPYGWSFASPTFHLLPFIHGRVLGSLPERGDVVIANPPGVKEDYIKRLIGLPGDRIEVRGGIVIINNVPVKRSAMIPTLVAVDANSPCTDYKYDGMLVTGKDGKRYCRMPVYYFGPIVVPENHVFLMGDNRDNSADSRFPQSEGGLGGPIPWENLGGRAEFITFSLDGTTSLNPLSWFTAFRGGRAGTSLRPKQGA
jgi:signal peptidase I